MERIEQLLEEQKNYKFINPKEYYENDIDFLNDCENYLKLNPSKKNEVLILKRVYFEGSMKRNKTNVFYLDKDLPTNELEKIFYLQDICNSYLENKEKTINKVRERYTKQSFEILLNSFKKKFLNYELYMDILLDIQNGLIEEKSIRKTYVDKNAIKKSIDNTEIAKIYNSGLSLFDYAFYNVINYSALNRHILSTNNVYTNEIRNRKNKTEEKVIELITALNDGKIDIFDLFKECKLTPQLLIIFAKNNKIHCRELSSYISSSMHYSPINEKKELEGKLVINSVEISNELKLKAMNTLRENNIQLSTSNYKKMIRKLIKEETR